MDSVSFSANICSFHSPRVSDIDRKLSSELKTMSRYYSLKINHFPSPFLRNAIISRIIILFQAPQSKSFDTNHKYSHNGRFFFLYCSLFTCPFVFFISLICDFFILLLLISNLPYVKLSFLF